MKIDLKLPSGTEFHYECQPMSKERFEAVCGLIALFLVGSGLFKILALTVR